MIKLSSLSHTHTKWKQIPTRVHTLIPNGVRKIEVDCAKFLYVGKHVKNMALNLA